MARKDVIRFADQLSDYFGPPKPAGGQDDGTYLKTWMKYAMDDFGFYSAEELERAFKILRATSKYRAMPANSEIIAACKQAAKELQVERPQLKVPTQTPAERNHKAREDIAIMLMRNSAMGKTACKEGWCGELFAYCRDNGHLPRTDSEIQLLVDGSRGTFDRIEGLKTGRIDVPGPMREKLISLGMSMLARREAITQAVVYEKPFRWGA